MDRISEEMTELRWSAWMLRQPSMLVFSHLIFRPLLAPRSASLRFFFSLRNCERSTAGPP